MYYDIFFNNPLAQYEQVADGVLISFPGPKEALVYAVSDRGSGRLHCLVNSEQLAQIDADNVAYMFIEDAPPGFKNGGNWSNHVFNPSGTVYKKNGKDWIHRTGSEAPEELDAE